MPYLAPVMPEPQEPAPSPGESEVRARLDALSAELREAGIPDSVALKTILAWAAQRAYEGGGYGVAKALSLNALEEVLFRASR